MVLDMGANGSLGCEKKEMTDGLEGNQREKRTCEA
jgi:hypothetical protein